MKRLLVWIVCAASGCTHSDAKRERPAAPPELPSAPVASVPNATAPAPPAAATLSASEAPTPPEPERCDTLAAGSDARALCEQIGPRPVWAVTGDKAAAEILADYGGVWTFAHDVPLYDSTSEEPVFHALDELRVCGAGKRVRWVLQSFGANAHSCALGGRVAASWNGELLLLSDSKVEVDVVALGRSVKGPLCHLRAMRVEGQLKIVDAWPRRCDEEDCGSGAAAVMMALPESRRRPGPCRARLSTHME